MSLAQKISVAIEGPLCKWTNLVTGWQYRWFVLDPDKGVLSYYTSKEKINRGERRGCVKLKAAQIGIDNEDDSTFTITVDHKTFHFQAQNADERQRWLDALQEVRDSHTHSKTFIQTHGNYLHPQDNSLADFERRIVEADVYLRLLIDQHNSLSIHLREIGNRSSTEDVLCNLSGIIENVKNTISSLQKARENALSFVPSNYNHTAENSDSLVGLRKNSNTVKNVPVEHPFILNNSNEHSIKGSSPIPTLSEISCPILQDLSVPAVSYSSDEEEVHWADEENATASGGEDIFFDTVENLPVRQMGSHLIRNSTSTSSFAYNLNDPQHSSDFDPLYDEHSEDDLGNLSAHGSVIMHLVSQVRIGMDLTKITLPTFILERRSTLEMYADFLAHADIWASIVDYDDPRDRFICALKWYLSAFHAGRRSSVAKKPYNPILGEIFRCYWDLDDSPLYINDKKSSSQKSSVTHTKDSLPPRDSRKHYSPIPWAPQNAVCFIAEQVSHHPPISAFYAEHKSRGLVCEGSLWTKSKFLGLSIGVEMVGSATLRIINLGEHYTVNFPGAYGRILLIDDKFSFE